MTCSSWSKVQENVQTTVRIFLPPEMTEQHKTLILQGPAIVRRVEKDRGGIALEFTKQLKRLRSVGRLYLNTRHSTTDEK